MAITTAMCTSFKVELLQGLQDFDVAGNVFKLGLFKTVPAGTYSAATTNYSDVTGNTDENTGTNYTAGGKTLTNVAPTSTSTTAFTDFDDQTWGTSSITADGAFIYNSSSGNRMVSVHDFGGPKQSSAGDFVIQFPDPTSAAAIIRIA